MNYEYLKYAWMFKMLDDVLKRLSNLYSGNEEQDLV